MNKNMMHFDFKINVYNLKKAIKQHKESKRRDEYMILSLNIDDDSVEPFYDGHKNNVADIDTIDDKLINFVKEYCEYQENFSVKCLGKRYNELIIPQIIWDNLNDEVKYEIQIRTENLNIV